MTIDLNAEKQLISKQNLLSEISDIDVFRRYISSDVNLTKNILSPLRKEDVPSFGLFVGQNAEICFKDFLLGAGDCIRFVQMKYGLTYFAALSKIATDFDLNKKYICKSFEKTNFEEESKLSLPTRDQLLSQVVSLKLGKNRRKWALHDIVFWQQFGISVKTLEFFNVEPVEYIHINNKIHKADKYAYCFVEWKDGKETYKIYQPYNKYYKWINNHDDSVWQGWEQLPKIGGELIITKSLKDVMSLYEVTGISAVSLQSENILPKHYVFEELDKRFGIKYSLYDNDFDKETNWGKKFGDTISRQFGLIEMYIPDEHKSKDFSDLVMNVGPNKAKLILEDQMMLPF